MNVTSWPSASHHTPTTCGMMLARLAFITRAYRARVGPRVTRSRMPILSLRTLLQGGVGEAAKVVRKAPGGKVSRVRLCVYEADLAIFTPSEMTLACPTPGPDVAPSRRGSCPKPCR